MFWRTKPEAQQTLQGVFVTYAEYAQLRHGSHKRYRCELNRWTKHTGDPPINAITGETILEFRRKCQSDGLENSTTESTIKIVKAMLRFARDRGWIQALPAWGRSLPVARPMPEPATIEELDKLYRACDGATINGCGRLSPCDWWRAWLTVGYFTGLRHTDLTYRLDWSHVLPDRIQFAASKTGSVHVFPLAEPVQRALQTMQTAARPDVVFGGTSPPHHRLELYRLCERAGVRRIGSQNIRQASVTSWLTADHTAGTLVHGTGLPHVLHHYVGVLNTLTAALPRFPWPEAMLS